MHVAEKLCKGCSDGKTHGDEQWFSNARLDSLDFYGVSSHPSLPLSVVCSCEMQATNICAPSSPVSRRCRKRWLVALQDRAAHHSKICGSGTDLLDKTSCGCGEREEGQDGDVNICGQDGVLRSRGSAKYALVVCACDRSGTPKPYQDQHSSSGSTTKPVSENFINVFH